MNRPLLYRLICHAAFLKKEVANMANYNYDNRKSYNNQPLTPGQVMVPVYVDWDMVRYYQMDPENLETWHIRGHKVLVAFTTVPEAAKANAMKLFWKDVRDHISMDSIDPMLTSYEVLTSSTAQNHYTENKSYEPQPMPSLERTTLLIHIIDDLIKEVHAINPEYGKILDLVKTGYDTKEILASFKCKKTQGYEKIKKAYKTARELYNK